jgi:hypothetical protein
MKFVEFFKSVNGVWHIIRTETIRPYIGRWRHHLPDKYEACVGGGGVKTYSRARARLLWPEMTSSHV